MKVHGVFENVAPQLQARRERLAGPLSLRMRPQPDGLGFRV